MRIKVINSTTKRLFQIYAVLLIGVMPLLASPWREEAYFDIKLVFTVIITIFMFVFLLLFDNKILLRPLSGMDWLVAAYAVLLVASTIFSINVPLSIKGLPNCREGLISLLCYLFIYILFSRLTMWDRWMMDLILICAALVSFYGILEFFGIIHPIECGNYSATFGNRNFTGTYCTIMLPLAVWSFLDKRKIRYWIFSSLIFILLLTSMTRSAWVALTVWLPLMAVLSLKDKKRINFLILFCISSVILFFILDNMTGNQISQRLYSILFDFSNPTSDEAGSYRMNIWKNSLKLLGDRPLLGSGPDTFGIVFFKLDGILDILRQNLPYHKAHNELLQILITTGYPALLAYLLIVIQSVKTGFKNVRKQLWLVPVLCALAGYLVQAMFNISVITTAPIFWAFLGLVAGNNIKSIY